MKRASSSVIPLSGRDDETIIAGMLLKPKTRVWAEGAARQAGCRSLAVIP
jgi:hypothetical protein